MATYIHIPSPQTKVSHKCSKLPYKSVTRTCPAPPPPLKLQLAAFFPPLLGFPFLLPPGCALAGLVVGSM